ncbi:MAG: prephenate dehydrogenase [Pseudomonadota bacterium]
MIGTSVALAQRAAVPDASIHGFDPAPASRQAAAARGVFDDMAESPQGAFDVAVVASPPTTVAAGVQACAALADLVVDVGSVKAPIVDALADDIPGNFVPSHPMRGSHLSGAAAASAELLAGGMALLTPLENTQPEVVERARSFWAQLGMRCEILTPAEHDAAVAFTSHAPHLLAWGYLATGQASPATVGPGFLGFMRLAQGDPALWADILRSNRREVARLLASLESELAEVRMLLEDDVVDNAVDKLEAYISARREEALRLVP